MEQQLEAREEGNLEIRETFSSLKEEVESKTNKLKKVRETSYYRVCVSRYMPSPPSLYTAPHSWCRS